MASELEWKNHIHSQDITAFPTVNRNAVSGDIYARHTSEEALTSIINKFMSVDSFVITRKADFGLNKPIEFNIHGYYFKVKELKLILEAVASDTSSDSNYIYACIDLETNGQWLELAGGDESKATENPPEDSYYYTSVYFTKDLAAAKEYNYYLELVQYVGTSAPTSWNNTGYCVPVNSYIKFTGPDYSLTSIDGGNLSTKD